VAIDHAGLQFFLPLQEGKNCSFEFDVHEMVNAVHILLRAECLLAHPFLEHHNKPGLALACYPMLMILSHEVFVRCRASSEKVQKL
jgi:hypothetical protein